MIRVGMASILDNLKTIIAEELGVDEEAVVPAASFAEDLNADASDLAELLISVEEAFSTPQRKVVISDAAINDIITVQDVIDLLRDYVPEE